MRKFLKHIANAPENSHGLKFVISVILAEPIAGFSCGVIYCSDCGMNPLNYLVIGVVHLIISTLNMGYCWTGGQLNLWPFVPFVAISIWLLLWIIDYLVYGYKKETSK